MRRLIAVALATAGLVVVGSGTGVVSTAKADDPPTCIKADLSTGLCVVTVTAPAGGGSTGGAGGGVRGAAASPVCTETPPGRAIPCTSDVGSWDQGQQCYLKLADPQPPKAAPVWEGHVGGAVYACTVASAVVGGGFPGTGIGLLWVAAPAARPVDYPALAKSALAKLVIPGPSTGRYPAGRLQDGRPYTAVSTYTWFWTDAAAWHSLRARASQGPAWAEVTVTPSGLTFTPGDGAAAVGCPGPGTAWQRSFGVYAASPSGCDYRYPHSSIDAPGQEVTATYAIRWTPTWTSSAGAGGTLPAVTTTAQTAFVVAEVESVVTP